MPLRYCRSTLIGFDAIAAYAIDSRIFAILRHDSRHAFITFAGHATPSVTIAFTPCHFTLFQRHIILP